MAQTRTGKKEEEFDVEVEVPLRLTVSQPVRLVSSHILGLMT
jgi:hypothetical protein